MSFYGEQYEKDWDECYTCRTKQPIRSLWVPPDHAMPHCIDTDWCRKAQASRLAADAQIKDSVEDVRKESSGEAKGSPSPTRRKLRRKRR